MTLPVVVIRPEPGCSVTTEAARAGGLDARAFPLFRIRPRGWEPAAAEEVDALLLGSANALRYGGESLGRFRDKPVYAVGEATAEAARGAGFRVAHVGTGGLQAVLDTIAGPMRLLRLAGEEHVPLHASAGVTLETRIVYAAEPVPMPPGLVELLREGAVVLLHSAAAARHFAAECNRLRVPRQKVRLAALGPRIAQGSGSGWCQLRFASKPAEGALLALAADLCHVSAKAKER